MKTRNQAAFVVKATLLGVSVLGLAIVTVTCPWWMAATLSLCLSYQVISLCD